MDHHGWEQGAEYPLCYWLDISNVIVDITGSWYEFAQENQAPELEIRRVVGRSLLDFIQGDATKMYVTTLIQLSRLVRRPLVRAYRCDSPECKRFMEMRLSIDGSGLLRWEHRLVKSEAFQNSYPFVTVSQPERPSHIVRCSMCNRLKMNKHWQEPEQALPQPEPGEGIPVIYGVCTTCRTGLQEAGVRRLPRASGLGA